MERLRGNLFARPWQDGEFVKKRQPSTPCWATFISPFGTVGNPSHFFNRSASKSEKPRMRPLMPLCIHEVGREARKPNGLKAS